MNKKLTWEEFTKLPLIARGAHNDIFEATHGDELVTFVKSISEIVGMMRIKDVETMGCSTNYIYEKVQAAITDLEWIAEKVAEDNDEVINCSSCRTFDSHQLNDDNECFHCADNKSHWRED